MGYVVDRGDGDDGAAYAAIEAEYARHLSSLRQSHAHADGQRGAGDESGDDAGARPAGWFPCTYVEWLPEEPLSDPGSPG